VSPSLYVLPCLHPQVQRFGLPFGTLQFRPLFFGMATVICRLSLLLLSRHSLLCSRGLSSSSLLPAGRFKLTANSSCRTYLFCAFWFHGFNGIFTFLFLPSFCCLEVPGGDLSERFALSLRSYLFFFARLSFRFAPKRLRPVTHPPLRSPRHGVSKVF